MLNSICPICGISFKKLNNLHRYCSKTCKSKARRKEKIKYKHICQYCNKEFFSFLKEQKYCNKKCSNNQYNLIDKKQRLTNRDKVCKICGKNYYDSGKMNKSKFCSLKCRKEYQYSKNRVKGLQIVICPICNTEFKQKRLNHRCCSEKCSDKLYKIENHEEILIKGKEYRNNNKHIAKKYMERNRIRLNKMSNERQKLRKKEDHIFRIKCVLRCTILDAFKNKGFKKSSRTEKILGCDYITFIEHLKKQLPKGETLENFGRYGFHIDHIIPLSTARTEEEVIKLNHYTNLRPLWYKDNWSKSDILPDGRRGRNVDFKEIVC
jgi:hypothetical protein